MAETPTTSIRLSEQDQRAIRVIQKRYPALTTTTATIKYALHEMARKVREEQ